MPDNRNKSHNQDPAQKRQQHKQGQGQGGQKGQERQQQSGGGGGGWERIESEVARQSGKQDQDVEQDEVTQRNPRQGEQGKRDPDRTR